MLPVLRYHFERSERGGQVFIGFRFPARC